MISNSGIETLKAVAAEIEKRYLKQTDVSSYSIKKMTTATTGYAASYQLMKGEEVVGDVINIPKDYLVKSASLKAVTTANSPVSGYVVGDKYIDFVINTATADGNESHIYLKVSDLVDTYTKGEGIDISSSNVVSIKINSSSANGLSASTEGLKLSLASETSAGAMSAEDKKRLNNSLTESDFNEITADEVKAIFEG